MERLQSEGLTRHDAIHAVATRLTDLIVDAKSGDTSGDKAVEQYYEGIRDLTKEKWFLERLQAGRAPERIEPLE